MTSNKKNDSGPYYKAGKPVLKKSIFAFVDVLGFSQQILESSKKGSSEKLLRNFIKAQKESFAVPKYLEDDETKRFFPKRREIQNFSDNIVIGYPIVDDGESELGSIFDDLTWFQFEMTIRGFFLRGSITVGDIFMDQDTVFGPALIEAHKLETTIADVPRIILSSEAEKYVKSHLEYYPNKDFAPQTHELLKDNDEVFFLNYLDLVLLAEDERGPFYDELEKHKSSVEGNLKKFGKNPKIFSKYLWSAKYHNCFCNLHSSIGPDYCIDLEAHQMGPARIIES